MKATIRRVDGTVIELDGTAEEVERVVRGFTPIGLVLTPPPTAINIPSTTITITDVGGCQHQYPSPWFGTVPPNCLKCAQPAYSTVPYFISGGSVP